MSRKGRIIKIEDKTSRNASQRAEPLYCTRNLWLDTIGKFDWKGYRLVIRVNAFRMWYQNDAQL